MCGEIENKLLKQALSAMGNLVFEYPGKGGPIWSDIRDSILDIKNYLEPTIYRIVQLKSGIMFVKNEAREVSIFMVGRRINEYIIIKSIGTTSKVVNVSSGDVSVIERECLEA